MLRVPFVFSLFVASFVPTVLSATAVGAYWAFQSDQTAETHVFSDAVSVNTLLNGSPVFSYSGSQQTDFNNFGLSFTAHDDSIWESGKAIGWNTNANPSTGNQFELTLDTTELEDLSVRIKYRLNGVQTSSGLMTAFAAFEYQIGAGAFNDVGGVDLALVNDASYNREWVADLSALSAIEDAGMVTLRWTIPDLIAVTGAQIRIDDVEILGTSTFVASNRVRHFPEQQYNVLFIAIDDLKPLIGAYGNNVIHTPNMDRLAASGITFTNTHCQQAICNASRVSVMTGLRVDKTKTWQLETHFRDTAPTVVTLPQHFWNNGYTTKAIGKIFHSTSAAKHDVANSWSDGFTHNNGAKKYYGAGPASAVALAEDGGDKNASSSDRGVLKRDGTTPVDDQSYNDGLNSDFAIIKLAEYATAYDNGNGTPFFMALGFQKPHLPFACPDEYWALYDDYMDESHPDYVDDYNLASYTGDVDARKGSVPTGSMAFTAPYAGEPSSYSDTPLPPTVTDARRLIHGYLACVSYVDNLLGEVLDELDAQGLTDSTIVVLWGDHGWHLNDHDGWWAKHSNFEQSTRSPLIVHVPGMASLGTAGKISNTPMELVDIYPTLLDLCGLPMSPQPAGFELEGQSFLPLLEDVDQPWKKAAFSQYRRILNGEGITNSGSGMGYTLRTERYRYTEWWRTDGTEVDGNGIVIDYDEKLHATPEFVELYDYAVDPEETINLATDPSYATVKSELSALLDEGNGWSQISVAPPFDYPDSVAEWQSRHLITGYTAADFDLAADPDADGLQNSLEYAMGKHPLSPDFGVMTSAHVGGNLVLEYDHVISRTDVTLEATTTDELTGTWAPTGVTDAVVEVLPNRTRKSASISVGPSAGFLRLEAEEVP